MQQPQSRFICQLCRVETARGARIIWAKSGNDASMENHITGLASKTASVLVKSRSETVSAPIFGQFQGHMNIKCSGLNAQPTVTGNIPGHGTSSGTAAFHHIYNCSSHEGTFIICVVLSSSSPQRLSAIVIFSKGKFLKPTPVTTTIVTNELTIRSRFTSHSVIRNIRALSRGDSWLSGLFSPGRRRRTGLWR